MRISLKPIGTIDNEIVEVLKQRLQKTFGCPIEISPQTNDLKYAFDQRRRQYLASAFLTKLEKMDRAKDEKVLGIVDADLYVPGLNFVFGQANISSGVAIIALLRLREEYYGLPQNQAAFFDRLTKEAVHELGHTFGLEHCTESRCVMHFSNSLQDTDLKQAAFCSQCRPKLIK